MPIYKIPILLFVIMYKVSKPKNKVFWWNSHDPLDHEERILLFILLCSIALIII